MIRNRIVLGVLLMLLSTIVTVYPLKFTLHNAKSMSLAVLGCVPLYLLYNKVLVYANSSNRDNGIFNDISDDDIIGRLLNVPCRIANCLMGSRYAYTGNESAVFIQTTQHGSSVSEQSVNSPYWRDYIAYGSIFGCASTTLYYFFKK